MPAVVFAVNRPITAINRAAEMPATTRRIATEAPMRTKRPLRVEKNPFFSDAGSAPGTGAVGSTP